MSDYEEKFGTLTRVYGEEVCDALRHAHVCVVGIGGVGSWAVESLVRSGVGKITLVDGDTIARSNMNRQVHTLESTIGRYKVDAMQARIADINAGCGCDAIRHHIGDENLRDILERGYDCVIDAIDSIKYKAAIVYCCKRNRIPVVMTGGAGGLTDPARIEVADLTRTWNDPLAATVRSLLRHKYGYTRNTKRTFGIPCVFSSEQQRYPDSDGRPGFCKPGVAGLSLDCSFGYGSVVSVTATFGFVAAAKAVELIARSASNRT
ncbi:MAG: tRNA threonylcarbamoyladenosine dehydratase [Gammaproteobacteria bacterium]|nr:tRNA threonylcarbamoyladenosine dehydratase [Gammaproteobacteria bacterium]